MNAFAWTAIATIFVFATSQIIQLFISIRRRSDQRNSLCKSLKAEINVILSLSGEAKSVGRFEAFIKRNSIKNINAYSFVALQSSVYKTFLSDLCYLDSETVALVTRFYCLFDIFNAFIAHFKSIEFIDADEDVQNEMKNFFIQNVRDLNEVGELLQSRLSA